MNLRIRGVGMALPKTSISNEELSTMVDTNDEWITTRTGIKNRYFSTHENTSDLATQAALEAINHSGINKSEIDVIIACTFTADNYTPSVASMVQKNLNLSQNLMAFDINAACSGFIVGLELAASLLQSHQTILLIGAEVISKILDFNDRATSILFGDGAGAVIVQSDQDYPFKVMNTAIIDEDDVLSAPGVALLNQLAQPQVLKMNGPQVFRFAVNALSTCINQMDEEVDLIIPHQANQRIIDRVATQLKIPNEKFYINLDRVGNTSAASIPIALAMAIKEKKVFSGDKILCIGFGAGLTMGACTFIL